MKKLLAIGVMLSGSAYALPLFNVEASVGYMNHNLSGTLRYQGDTIDLQNTLGLDKTNKPFARAKIELPIVPNLYLQYMPMTFTGTKTRTVTYGGKTISGSLDTTLKLDRYDVGLYYNIPVGWVTSVGTLGTLSIDPEIGVNVRVINYEGSITGNVAGNRETVTSSSTIPVPMAYAGLGLNLPFVSLIGELRYVSYSGSSYYDITGEARVKPIPMVFVGVGYRQENLKIDNVSDIYTDITIKSYFANVGVSF